jgi:hypothetical protein
MSLSVTPDKVLSGHFTSKGYVIKRYKDAKQGIVWNHNSLGTDDSSLILSAFFRLVIVFYVSLCVTMTLFYFYFQMDTLGLILVYKL